MKASVLSALIRLTETGYSADGASMTTFDRALAFFVAMATCVYFGMILWRKHGARLRKKDQKLRDAQFARLRFLEDRMKGEPSFGVYQDVENLRLAGLLAAPRDEPSERW